MCDLKQALWPVEKCELVDYSKSEHAISTRLALKIFSTQPSIYFSEPKPSDDQQIRDELASIAEINTRWGFWMKHGRLRNLNYLWNHKKVYRIYRQMGLNLRRNHKKRLPARVVDPLLWSIMPNITWNMDFMHDKLSNGVSFKTFNVIDYYNREGIAIYMNTCLNSKRVIRELDQLIAWGANQSISASIMAWNLYLLTYKHRQTIGA
jgi:putative transposase